MMLSFMLCIITSIILYITPHGRVAYWSDWHFWFLSKTQWSELHLNLGILLLVAGFLHIFYNWKPLIAYLKNKAKQFNIMTVNFMTALILTLVFGFGTFFQVPPLVSIINFSTKIKDQASITYGEPPYGHAELSSLKMFAGKVKLDLEKSLQLLEQSGITFTSETQTIKEIAKTNNLSPKDIFEIIKPAAQQISTENTTLFPDTPPPGFGNKTLDAVFTEFQLDRQKIMLFMTQRGIKADSSMSIKENALANNMNPMSLFELLGDAVTQK